MTQFAVEWVERTKDGALRTLNALLEAAPESRQEHLLALVDKVDGRGVRLCVDLYRRKHTDSQRGYYWTLVEILAQHVGHSKNGMHEVLLAELHGADDLTIGARVYRVPRGRSHNLEVTPYGELIETCHRTAAFMDPPIVLPEPEPTE